MSLIQAIELPDSLLNLLRSLEVRVILDVITVESPEPLHSRIVLPLVQFVKPIHCVIDSLHACLSQVCSQHLLHDLQLLIESLHVELDNR